MRESRLQSKIISYLKANGIYYVNTYGSGMTAKGVPDLLICLNGKFIAFECKVDNNGMQPDQKIHEIRITRSMVNIMSENVERSCINNRKEGADIG